MHVIDSFGTGGAEEGIRKLLAGLDPAAFEQSVCTVAPFPQVAGNDGARMISVGRRGGGRLLLLGKLKRACDRERPHIVHSRNWGAIEGVLAARIAGVPAVVHSEHGLELTTYRRQPWRRNVVRRLCFRLADRVFTVSSALKTYYADQSGVLESRIAVIPNGVDTERFRRDEDMRFGVRQKWGASPSTVVIGTVGRLDPIKDHRTLFTAVSLLLALGVPVQLVVVGDGPKRKELEADVHTHEGLAARTMFVGATHDVVAQLNGFDIFVLPSLAEGMSNALLEAMSVGVACVASRVGGNTEVIEEGLSGLLFEPGDSLTLAGHLKRLASDSERRRDLGQNARRRVETLFSLNRMLNNYVGLYDGVLAGRQHKSWAGIAQRLHDATASDK